MSILSFSLSSEFFLFFFALLLHPIGRLYLSVFFFFSHLLRLNENENGEAFFFFSPILFLSAVVCT